MFKFGRERPKFERKDWMEDFDRMPANAVGYVCVSSTFSARFFATLVMAGWSGWLYFGLLALPRY